MGNNIAISVKGVSKNFKLPHEKNSSIKSAVINFYKRKRTFEKQEVLKDVSFDIEQGEFFGIVGRNGSGKSTLLKMLAEIYVPSQGKIEIKGKLTPFIELGVGFNPELTGRENVYLNGALLGFSRKEILGMYDEIVTFAELEKFMDQKLKNYSSGMQVRLAFSIAIRARSEILVLDEVLAVGDAAFQKKCIEHFTLLKAAKQTVVFVSHDMDSVRKYCDRVAWIDKGILRDIGKPKDIIPQYMELFVTNEQTEQLVNSEQGLPIGISSAITINDDIVEIKDAWLGNKSSTNTKALSETDKALTIGMKIKALKSVKSAVPGVVITNNLDEFITASNTVWGDSDNLKDLKEGKEYNVIFTLPNIFEKGDYKVSVNVVSPDMDIFYAWKNKAASFKSIRQYHTGGKVNPTYSVRIEAA